MHLIPGVGTAQMGQAGAGDETMRRIARMVERRQHPSRRLQLIIDNGIIAQPCLHQRRQGNPLPRGLMPQIIGARAVAQPARRVAVGAAGRPLAAVIEMLHQAHDHPPPPTPSV